jgi:DNA primase
MIRAVLAHYGADLSKVRANSQYWQAIKCPFHGDMHESASVNMKYDVFKCHGCDAAGSAVGLIVQQEGVSRSEAEQRAEEFADEFGGDIPSKPSSRDGLPGKARTVSQPRGW